MDGGQGVGTDKERYIHGDGMQCSEKGLHLCSIVCARYRGRPCEHHALVVNEVEVGVQNVGQFAQDDSISRSALTGASFGEGAVGERNQADAIVSGLHTVLGQAGGSAIIRKEGAL